MSQLKVNSIVPTGGLPSGANGGIIQIVQAESTTQVSTTSTTLVDTGLSGTITPQSNSNKILIVVSIGWDMYRNQVENAGSFNILRGSTQIQLQNNILGSQLGLHPQGRTQIRSNIIMQELDSPATTSATTYKVQFRNDYNGADGAFIRTGNNSNPNIITLYEVST